MDSTAVQNSTMEEDEPVLWLRFSKHSNRDGIRSYFLRAGITDHKLFIGAYARGVRKSTRDFDDNTIVLNDAAVLMDRHHAGLGGLSE